MDIVKSESYEVNENEHQLAKSSNNNERCLVSVKNAIMAKNGKTYKFFCGNAVVGSIVVYHGGGYGRPTSGCSSISVGPENSDKKVIIPIDNIAGIQNTEKIFGESVYTVE